MFNIKNPFSPSLDELVNIAWNEATRRYNIVKEDEDFYITYEGRKVSTEEDSKDKAKLVDRLQEYRDMFVKEFVNNKGERQ